MKILIEIGIPRFVSGLLEPSMPITTKGEAESFTIANIFCMIIGIMVTINFSKIGVSALTLLGGIIMIVFLLSSIYCIIDYSKNWK